MAAVAASLDVQEQHAQGNAEAAAIAAVGLPSKLAPAAFKVVFTPSVSGRMTPPSASAAAALVDGWRKGGGRGRRASFGMVSQEGVGTVVASPIASNPKGGMLEGDAVCCREGAAYPMAVAAEVGNRDEGGVGGFQLAGAAPALSRRGEELISTASVTFGVKAEPSVYALAEPLGTRVHHGKGSAVPASAAKARGSVAATVKLVAGESAPVSPSPPPPPAAMPAPAAANANAYAAPPAASAAAIPVSRGFAPSTSAAAAEAEPGPAAAAEEPPPASAALPNTSRGIEPPVYEPEVAAAATSKEQTEAAAGTEAAMLQGDQGWRGKSSVVVIAPHLVQFVSPKKLAPASGKNHCRQLAIPKHIINWYPDIQHGSPLHLQVKVPAAAEELALRGGTCSLELGETRTSLASVEEALSEVGGGAENSVHTKLVLALDGRVTVYNHTYTFAGAPKTLDHFLRWRIVRMQKVSFYLNMV